MMDYYVFMSIALSILGLQLIVHGIKRNSNFEAACGVIPIMTVFLYWSMVALDIARTAAGAS
jgi:hypothetical protein